MAAPARNYIIYSYFIATTKIGDVFNALFKSFVNQDTILKLNPKNDAVLIGKLESTMNAVFPTSVSTISVKYETNLLNVFWRVLGLTIPGKEDAFEKAGSYNTEFKSTLESIIANVVAGMIDNPAVPLKLSNPSALVNELNMLKTQLSDRTNNLVNTTANFWADSFDKLIALLMDADFGKALNISNIIGADAEAKAQRLMRVAEEVGVTVPANCESFFVLAEKLGEFLAKVENTNWSINKAKDLYPDTDDLFHTISHHWGQVTGKKFYEEAIALRHS